MNPWHNFHKSLNFNYNVFGILTNGFDTFRKLIGTPTDPSTDRPLHTATIVSAAVFTDVQNGVLKSTMHRDSPAARRSPSSPPTALATPASSNSPALNVVGDTVNDPAFLGPVSNQVTNMGTPVTSPCKGSIWTMIR